MHKSFQNSIFCNALDLKNGKSCGQYDLFSLGGQYCKLGQSNKQFWSMLNSDDTNRHEKWIRNQELIRKKVVTRLTEDYNMWIQFLHPNLSIK